MLNARIFENRVTISLDSSGEPLNQRGYRIESTKAPLNEVAAAGIIMKTGWRGDSISWTRCAAPARSWWRQP